MQHQAMNRAHAICVNYANAQLQLDAGVNDADLDLAISVQEAKWLGLSAPDAGMPAEFADKPDLTDAWSDGVSFAVAAAMEKAHASC
jgi:hypothetical protein